MNHTTAPTDWHLVIPVKGGPGAKSRLNAPDGIDHGSLANALALDTVTAAAAAVTPLRVVVVTSDPTIVEQVTALGVHVLMDSGSGLNPAVRAGLAELGRTGHEGATGVLLGDLPAARVVDLDQALAASAERRRSFVPDADGTGTVLLTSVRRAGLAPRFGPGSASAHEGAGYCRLDLDLPTLRTDVDDEESLRTVLCLGVGSHTARLLAHYIAPESAELRDRGA